MPTRPTFPHGGCCKGGLACGGGADDLGSAAVRTAVERAAFGGESGRRRIVGLVGAGAVAAALDRAFPILRAQEVLAQAPAAPEVRPAGLAIGVLTAQENAA